MARGDLEKVQAGITDDILWQQPNQQDVKGPAAFSSRATRYGPAASLALDTVVSHGKSGVVDGVIAFGKKKRAFCHVFEFANARGKAIQKLTTYSLALK
jgi:hypothetical protein